MNATLKSALSKRGPSSQGWIWIAEPTKAERKAFAELKRIGRPRR